MIFLACRVLWARKRQDQGGVLFVGMGYRGVERWDGVQQVVEDHAYFGHCPSSPSENL